MSALSGSPDNAIGSLAFTRVRVLLFVTDTLVLTNNLQYLVMIAGPEGREIEELVFSHD